MIYLNFNYRTNLRSVKHQVTPRIFNATQKELKSFYVNVDLGSTFARVLYFFTLLLHPRVEEDVRYGGERESVNDCA